MRRLSRLDLYSRGIRRAVLLGTAGAALAAAAADPRWEDEAPEPPPPPVKQVILAIDVSASMQAEDEAPTRLARAVSAAEAALPALEGHEVGLLLFAGTAYHLAPPTLDHEAIRFLLGGVAPRLASAQDPGTLLSVAIDESMALMARRPSETPGEAAPRGAPGPGGSSAPEAGSDGGRLIVLVSDGDVGESEESVTAAVERAVDAGVQLYAIGVGTDAGTGMVMPAGAYQLGGPILNARGEPAASRLRESLLRRVADTGGGAYARAGAEPDEQAMYVALADTGPAPDPVRNASAPVWARYDLPFVLGALALALVALESLLGMSLPALRVARAREAA
jgi:Ca-activated chloride channel family protein